MVLDSEGRVIYLVWVNKCSRACVSQQTDERLHWTDDFNSCAASHYFWRLLHACSRGMCISPWHSLFKVSYNNAITTLETLDWHVRYVLQQTCITTKKTFKVFDFIIHNSSLLERLNQTQQLNFLLDQLPNDISTEIQKGVGNGFDV